LNTVVVESPLDNAAPDGSAVRVSVKTATPFVA
jgi:hypothetical protein